MEAPALDPAAATALEQVLGYMNFSAGPADPKVFAAVDEAFGIAAKVSPSPHLLLGSWLRTRLRQLQSESPAFAEAEQADGVVNAIWDSFFGAYREFHHELICHRDDASLYRSLFVARILEAVLQMGGPWDEPARLVDGAIAQLSDFVGYRPVAMLENKKTEPYPHERIRPIPLYIAGCGVGFGPEKSVIEGALALLESTEPALLRAAQFDPDLLDELAVDPRAYDFEHPANKRPNYHFGLWDPDLIDNKGCYRRFVVQQVTLDALMDRLGSDEAPAEELLFEASAVLAGTVLMASAIGGYGPGAFDSTTTLSLLLPHVAQLRDVFYERLIEKVAGSHATRLQQEASRLRQPFGGARQHLNAQLARRRASQLEHVQLAKIYARMGYLEPAAEQVAVVSVASARALCDLDCQLTTADRLIAQGELEQAAQIPQRALAAVKRSIECGAIVDPWNMLGFDAQFSLFPAAENSIHDHRVDELIGLVERILALYSRLWGEAAATDNSPLSERIDDEFRELAQWWRQFAAHEIESVDCPDASETYNAARHVAGALNLWHKGGAETGNVSFWAPHVSLFDSPKAYTLVIEALLVRGDFIASMALMNHWLGQVDRIPLEQGDCSFQELTEAWVEQFQSQLDGGADDCWDVLKKFFDYLEANAEEYWQAPEFELLSAKQHAEDLNGVDEDELDDEDNLFRAAYEDVVYRDSTDDGVDNSLFEAGDEDLDELTRESNRLTPRLAFLNNIARLWKMVAVRLEWIGVADLEAARARVDAFSHWIQQAEKNRTGLVGLLDQVRAHRIPHGLGDHESMVEYDRRRLVKETLLDRVIMTCVGTRDAERLLLASLDALQRRVADENGIALGDEAKTVPNWPAPDDPTQSCIDVYSAVYRRDIDEIRGRLPELIDGLQSQPLLYVPLSKGGDPTAIVESRMRQRTIYDLLVWLPRCGLLVETITLIEAAREMERNCPVGPGAVTEFDEIFAAGFRSLVESIVRVCEEIDDGGDTLIDLLEKLTESLLVCWLAHSRTLRLSVLEKVHKPAAWTRLVDFIKRHGDSLFTQRFLNLSNIRAILHQGVESWLEQMRDYAGGEERFPLLNELDELQIGDVVEHLTLVLESVIENYGEYRDYNSTTTQSDRGELLYMLLDFLRLRSQYDRVAWKLRPVVLAHDVLIRSNCDDAAKSWREALRERVTEEADGHLKRLQTLQTKYAMRMPTVADRLGERFVMPLDIDSMRALVQPAIAEVQAAETPHFDRLAQTADEWTAEPTGVGLDAPPWLIALEDEVESSVRPDYLAEEDIALHAEFPPVKLSLEEAHRQLESFLDDSDTGEESAEDSAPAAVEDTVEDSGEASGDDLDEDDLEEDDLEESDEE